MKPKKRPKYKRVQLDQLNQWILKKETIDSYFSLANKTILDGKLFRRLIYNDPDYVDWCVTHSRKNKIPLKYNGKIKKRILFPGLNCKNWKSNTGDYYCESFHYIKKLYDNTKKNEYNQYYRKLQFDIDKILNNPIDYLKIPHYK